jgi:hypothetical protein
MCGGEDTEKITKFGRGGIVPWKGDRSFIYKTVTDVCTCTNNHTGTCPVFVSMSVFVDTVCACQLVQITECVCVCVCVVKWVQL